MQRLRVYRAMALAFALAVLVAACLGGWLYNALLLTLPADAERALVERVRADKCGGSACDEIAIFNLSRMSTGDWCVNLNVTAPLEGGDARGAAYVLSPTGAGRWSIRTTPGSVCDTWSFEGRRYLVGP